MRMRRVVQPFFDHLNSEERLEVGPDLPEFHLGVSAFTVTRPLDEMRRTDRRKFSIEEFSDRGKPGNLMKISVNPDVGFSPVAVDDQNDQSTANPLLAVSRLGADCSRLESPGNAMRAPLTPLILTYRPKTGSSHRFFIDRVASYQSPILGFLASVIVPNGSSAFARFSRSFICQKNAKKPGIATSKGQPKDHAADTQNFQSICDAKFNRPPHSVSPFKCIAIPAVIFNSLPSGGLAYA